MPQGQRMHGGITPQPRPEGMLQAFISEDEGDGHVPSPGQGDTGCSRDPADSRQCEGKRWVEGCSIGAKVRSRTGMGYQERPSGRFRDSSSWVLLSPRDL